MKVYIVTVEDFKKKHFYNTGVYSNPEAAAEEVRATVEYYKNQDGYDKDKIVGMTEGYAFSGKFADFTMMLENCEVFIDVELWNVLDEVRVWA